MNKFRAQLPIILYVYNKYSISYRILLPEEILQSFVLFSFYTFLGFLQAILVFYEFYL